MEKGVRQLLLCRQRRTVVLVTHRLQLLELANHVIALQAGTVRAQVSMHELFQRLSLLEQMICSTDYGM